MGAVTETSHRRHDPSASSCASRETVGNHIRKINIFNRTDCCQNRLTGYNVRYSADSTDGWNGSWPYVATNQVQVLGW